MPHALFECCGRRPYSAFRETTRVRRTSRERIPDCLTPGPCDCAASSDGQCAQIRAIPAYLETEISTENVREQAEQTAWGIDRSHRRIRPPGRPDPKIDFPAPSRVIASLGTIGHGALDGRGVYASRRSEPSARGRDTYALALTEVNSD